MLPLLRRPGLDRQGRRNVDRMLAAEAQMFACESWIIFGREVVPDVWRTSATVCGSARPSGGGEDPPTGPSNPNTHPSGSVRSENSSTAMPRFRATSRTGESLFDDTMTARASRSAR